MYVLLGEKKDKLLIHKCKKPSDILIFNCKCIETQLCKVHAM